MRSPQIDASEKATWVGGESTIVLAVTENAKLALRMGISWAFVHELDLPYPSKKQRMSS